MSRRTVPLLAAVLVLGTLMGWWLHGEPPVVLPEQPVVPPAAPAHPLPKSIGSAPPSGSSSQAVRLGATLAEERRTSEELRAELDAMKNPPARPRIPFPMGGPREAKEQGLFREIADRAIAECAPGLMLEAVDCTEYPCIGFARERAPHSARSRLNLNQCQPWQDVFGDRTAMQTRGIAGDGGVERFLAFYAYPMDGSDDLLRTLSDAAHDRISGYFEPLGRTP